MTRVTTFTEFSNPAGKVINAHNDQGVSGSLVFANDEAVITMTDSDNEPNQFHVHPDDAFMEFLSEFFGEALN